MPATICVYALVPAGAERVAGTGVAGERLRTHRVGAIGAVIGTHKRKATATEHNLRRHDGVMRSLMERFAAVTPVRFATYVADPAELGVILEARQASLKRALALVRNRAQMNVRIQGAVGRGPGAGLSQAAGPKASGTEYLKARAAEQRAPELDPLRPIIAKWIKEERVERRGSVVSVYHLVPRRSVEAYRSALQGAAEAQGVRLLVSGPWAPYAFSTW